MISGTTEKMLAGFTLNTPLAGVAAAAASVRVCVWRRCSTGDDVEGALPFFFRTPLK